MSWARVQYERKHLNEVLRSRKNGPHKVKEDRKLDRILKKEIEENYAKAFHR